MATDASIEAAASQDSSHALAGSSPPAFTYDGPAAGRAIRGERAGREGWTGTTDGRGLATFLGWFSIALGAAELLAPRGTLGAIGVRPSRGNAAILRGMGVREIASGVGILSNPESKEWVGSRVAGDVVDLALLSCALLKAERPARTLLATAAVLGVGLLDVLGTEQLAEARKSPTRDGAKAFESRVLRSITVGCSRAEAYAHWRDFTRFPSFMEGIESVETVSDRRSRWRARGPLGTSATWESEIVSDKPDELIAWRSVEGSTVYHGGTVHFADAPREQGTVVTVEMSYAPPGGKIVSGLLKMFRKEPGQQIGDDLRRFKQVMELGEVLLSDASAGSTPRHAQPLAQRSPKSPMSASREPMPREPAQREPSPPEATH
ncbi:MAG TPA: SRPBCC family protein [Gammaproteobacteria bacterium]|nr:SRPBCC family protein [Gammaproteobacteria bacterium]